MLWCGSVKEASLPSVFARLASLLALHAQPNPMYGRCSACVCGGARVETVALGEAIWVSHLQRSNGCDSYILAACSKRLPTIGPDDRGERLPRRLR